MVVYRVEMPDGLGPYWSKTVPGLGQKLAYRHVDIERHPDPYRDFTPDQYTRDLIFGFSSMKQLFSWFGGFVSVILKNGGKIVKYNVNKKYVVTGKSGRQLAFSKNKAKLVTA